jgi:hypothetical protein
MHLMLALSGMEPVQAGLAIVAALRGLYPPVQASVIAGNVARMMGVAE